MTSAPAPRNPRLYPTVLHSRYAVLTRLRQAMEDFVKFRVAGQHLETVLDIGAGTTPYRGVFAPHVAKYITIDLPGSGADVDVAPDGTIPLPDGLGQVILSNQVLEHVEDPLDHARELARLLAPDGVALLSTHGHWMYHPTPTDYWRWTGPGLRKLMSTAGLETLETRGVLGRAAAGLQLAHDGVIERFHPRLRPLLAIGLNAAQFVADKLDQTDRNNDACVFILTLRRARRDAATG